MNEHATTGEIIKEARERAGLSLAGLADQLDRTESSVRSWESGRSVPTLAMAGRLAAVLGVDPGALARAAALAAGGDQ